MQEREDWRSDFLHPHVSWNDLGDLFGMKTAIVLCKTHRMASPLELYASHGAGALSDQRPNPPVPNSWPPKIEKMGDPAVAVWQERDHQKSGRNSSLGSAYYIGLRQD
jgi:hypothetical protein